MHYFKQFTGWALAAGCAAVLVTGCSNSGSSQLPATGAAPAGSSYSAGLVAFDAGLQPSALAAERSKGLIFADPAAVKAQIFVAEYSDSNSIPVIDFNANNQMNKKGICQIAGVGMGINALGIDSAGTLWVPQGLDPATGKPDVVSFAPNCGAAGVTLVNPKGQAAGIAFASDGTRYVDDISGLNSTAGNVTVYPKGKTKPARYLTNANIAYATGVGVDSKNNVYLSYHTPASATGILLFKSGQMPGKPIKNINLGAPGMIAFDKHDNMIVTDDVNLTLNVYAPPYTGAPHAHPLQGASPQCSLNKAQSNLACGDKPNASVDIYSYPGGKYQYSFNKGLGQGTVIGVAQDPR
jgi:hypothetical protein